MTAAVMRQGHTFQTGSGFRESHRKELVELFTGERCIQSEYTRHYDDEKCAQPAVPAAVALPPRSNCVGNVLEKGGQP